MFTCEIRNLVLVTALGCAAVGTAQAQSNEDERLRLFKVAVEDALPKAIGGDNSALVENLLSVDLGEQLSKTFDLGKVRGALFGRGAPGFDPNCQRTGTAAGGPAQDECTASAGDVNSDGEYKELNFSKNIGLGNIKFLYRPKPKAESEETDPSSLKVGLSDQAAFDTALSLLTNTMGLSMSELAIPPAGLALPVKSLIIGTAAPVGAAKVEPIVIQKVVFLPRGLTLKTPIPEGNFMITKVRAPGQAWVAMGDPIPTEQQDPAKRMGIKAVGISDWQDLRRNTKLDPSRAKSRAELVDDIARELSSQTAGANAPPLLKILIGLSSESQGTFGLLLPAVQVYASPMPKNLEEKDQEAFVGKSTAGSVFEIPLVKTDGKVER